MRRLSARLIENLPAPADAEDIIPSIGHALSQVRGRQVRVRSAVFPPMTASGLWVDRTHHDLIIFEANTDQEHQLVIIGHEAWHMFNGHCGSDTHHGPAAHRTDISEVQGTHEKILAVIAQCDLGTDAPLTERMDADLHFATRAQLRQVNEELEAEQFGVWFATNLQAVLNEIRSTAHQPNVAGRIQASMAHRFHQT